MSSSSRSRAMEALKQGNISSDEEEEEYCNEGNDDLDDFVIDDQDIGYKASAHQKQSQSRDRGHTHTRNNRKASHRATNHKSSTQSHSQSYSISRRKRQHKAKKTNTISQPKIQSSVKSFFKPCANKPRNVVQTTNRKKSTHKKKKKAPKKQNDDDFMSNILTNMDSEDDADDCDVMDHSPNPRDEATTNHNNAMGGDLSMDIEHEDEFETQPQTQATPFPTQATEPQTHYTPHDTCEPPKKRFKMTPARAPSHHEDTTPTHCDKMEMDDDEEPDAGSNDSKEAEEIPPPQTHSMFDTNTTNANNNNNNNDTVTAEAANTDTYPSCAPGYIDLFWFDAYEDAVRKPGEIYLFGKTWNGKASQWQSVCLFIRNIERVMYVLPRLKNKRDDIENGERVEFINVYNEINEKRQRLGIRKFAAGPIEKKYCFRERAEGIPSVATYLKLCYSFDHGTFEGNGFGSGNTYQRVFGARSTALELFILAKQLMGPCWLRVPYRKPSRIVSWCRQELEVQNMDDVTVLSSNYPSPPFKVLSLSFQTVLNDKKEHHVACISGVIHNTVYVDHSNNNNKENENNSNNQMEYFSFIRKMDRNPFPYNLEQQLKKKNFNCNSNTFREFASERELLTYFTTRIHKLDPDVIVGHSLYDFLLDVLLHRMDRLNINMWSKMGRLRKKKIPFVKGRLLRKYLGAGRLLCDTFLSAQEFIHEKTYTLSHLVVSQLGIASHENLNPTLIAKQWFDGTQLASIITHCCNDSNLVFNLMQKLDILPLTKQLTNLCGNLWARSLTSQRAERNEWLLLHEFHRNGYIVPERWTNREKQQKGIIHTRGGEKGSKKKKRGKAQYAGGLVLEPVRGLYDKYVICLDFNSLYPSIIQEYNLCFTSTPHWQYNTNHNDKGEEDAKEKDVTLMQQDIAAETGILPKVIGVLLTRRSTVKGLLKSAKIESEKKRFDIQQKALKLVANSMYGCLGFEHSRFYCKPIAALITALGRESLMKASEIASSIGGNLRVIYGDTDSIFIYTDCDNLLTARNFASQIKKKVNKTYNKMYLELDYVFSKMLLLRKKKYAAIKVISFDTDPQSGAAIDIKSKKEIKGLDLVRRDWSIISKEVGQAVLDCILSPAADAASIDDVVIAIHELLGKYRRLMDENKIELNRFVITKKLTKQPGDYPDPTKQPHVMVAIEMQKLGMNIKTGSFIEYIICKQNRDGSNASSGNKSIAQRAYHIKEIETSSDADGVAPLEVDREWYLEQQILPPVGRYCDVIEGTDMGHLAHALGLDSNKFNHLNRNNNNNNHSNGNGNDDESDTDDIDDKILRIMNPLQKYGEICVPLKIKCRHCGNTYDFGGVFNLQTIDAKCGLICATVGCKGIVSFEDTPQQRRIDIARIKNSLSLQIWHFIYEYYARQWQCMDIACNHSTRQMPLNGNQCPKIGCAAKMKESYTASKLFDQLRYFAFLFDKKQYFKLLKQEKKGKNHQLTAQEEMVFDEIYKWCKQTILQKSKYYFIDSSQIFKYCM